MRILGIDPGLNITGYGLIEIVNNKPELLHFGHIRTKAKQNLSERLQFIFEQLNTVIQNYQPHTVAVEDLFYADNVKTAIIMGHARGTAIVAATSNKAKVSEFSAREVKMSVVGNGAASKQQVKFMVCNMLKIKDISPEDASDALAVALCEWHRESIDRKIKR